jgi:basic membrane lipoprotein Med (substrate-binding protein (PBP1-ABC) superfamily)
MTLTTTKLSRRAFMQTLSALGLAAGGSGWLKPVSAQEPLKVGVVYVSPVAEIGWTKQHSLGAAAIKQALGDQVELTIIDNVFQPQDAERVFRELAGSGHQLIFGTSFSHGTPLLKVAPRFPEVAFEHCSGLKHLANLGTFEAKYYEGTYLAGVASGLMSQNKKIGFIGGFPIPDIVGPANALLLGAQRIEPATTCSVIFLNSWYDPAKEKEATSTLIAQGCDVICSMTDTATGVQVAEQQGAWSIGYASDMRAFGPTKNLTSFILDWSSVYVKAAQDVKAGIWKPEVRWQGLKQGIVKMAPYSEAIPQQARDELATLEADIDAGTVHPYAGEIKDQSGTVRVPAGDILADADIRGFNWFVEGMIGNLG